MGEKIESKRQEKIVSKENFQATNIQQSQHFT